MVDVVLSGQPVKQTPSTAWFTTDILPPKRKVPESGARSVPVKFSGNGPYVLKFLAFHRSSACCLL